jgi:hypothetical protein
MAIDERVYYLKVVMILATTFAILGMFSIAVRFVVKVRLELSRIWQHQTPLLSVTPRPLDSFACTHQASKGFQTLSNKKWMSIPRFLLCVEWGGGHHVSNKVSKDHNRL